MKGIKDCAYDRLAVEQETYGAATEGILMRVVSRAIERIDGPEQTFLLGANAARFFCENGVIGNVKP